MYNIFSTVHRQRMGTEAYKSDIIMFVTSFVMFNMERFDAICFSR